MDVVATRMDTFFHRHSICFSRLLTGGVRSQSRSYAIFFISISYCEFTYARLNCCVVSFKSVSMFSFTNNNPLSQEFEIFNLCLPCHMWLLLCFFCDYSWIACILAFWPCKKSIFSMKPWTVACLLRSFFFFLLLYFPKAHKLGTPFHV